jgi:hypothetical protein
MCLLLLFFGGIVSCQAATPDSGEDSPDCQYYPVAVHFLEEIRTTLESPCHSAPLPGPADLASPFPAPAPMICESHCLSLPPPHPLVDLMSFQQ